MSSNTISCWPQRLSSNKKRVIEELVQGQEFATQLQILFQKPSEKGECVSAEELVQKILRSFNDTLSMLSSVGSAEVSHNQATSNNDSPCCDDDQRSEDSSESRKRLASKDKRGCYKRKRGVETWTIVSSTMEDGHSWRKYGQKEILNSKHPRSYFRCTRKCEQGCKAIKRVQRMEDDSQMYQTIYIGNHTCIDPFKKAPQIITGSESWEPYMVAFGDPRTQSKQHHVNPSTTLSIKQETKEETTTTTTTTTTTASDLTELDSIMWKDIIGGGGMGSDYGDVVVSNVYPCSEITSQSLELDFVIRPVEFENYFKFDESECLV